MQKNIQNITAVIEYIEAHLTGKLTWILIADAVHYSGTICTGCLPI